MAFPHQFVTRASWFVSAVVAVVLLTRGMGRDDDAPVSDVTSANLVPEILPDRAMEWDADLAHTLAAAEKSLIEFLGGRDYEVRF